MRDLPGEIARITPGEILLSETVKETRTNDFDGIPVTTLPDWHFDGQRGAALIKEKFGLEALAARGLENEPEILAGSQCHPWLR